MYLLHGNEPKWQSYFLSVSPNSQLTHVVFNIFSGWTRTSWCVRSRRPSWTSRKDTKFINQAECCLGMALLENDCVRRKVICNWLEINNRFRNKKDTHGHHLFELLHVCVISESTWSAWSVNLSLLEQKKNLNNNQWIMFVVINWTFISRATAAG